MLVVVRLGVVVDNTNEQRCVSVRKRKGEKHVRYEGATEKVSSAGQTKVTVFLIAVMPSYLQVLVVRTGSF